MKQRFDNFWQNIQSAINLITAPSTLNPDEGLNYWRERVFLALVFSSVILGLLAFIPGIVAYAYYELWNIIILNVLIYIFLILLFIFREIRFKLRIYGLLFLYYIFGMTLLIYDAQKGPGLIWMFTFPIFTGLLLNIRESILAILINLMSLFILTILIKLDLFSHFPLSKIDMKNWLTLTSSFIALNSIVAISVTVLVNGLEASLKKEQRYRQLLKEKQQKLAAAKDKAEESDRLKTSFLANMSHEIRTPMNAIIGFSDLLANPNISYAQREKYVTIIKNNGLSLVNLIDDIIDLAIIEANQVKIIKKECNVNELLDDLYEHYGDELQKVSSNGVELKIKKGNPNSEINIVSDPIRLKQILTNLIDNALKFTSKGYIEYGYFIEEEDNIKYIKFYVEDTGPGIPKDKQQQIFDHFTKIEQSRGRLFRGTGLGLTIAKKLTMLLGGRLWLKSKEGEGTTFFFTINYEVLP